MPSAITLCHVKKCFGGEEIFRDFHIAIEEGKITAIFGPNGSGKSTLLNILSGIVPPDGGRITREPFHPSTVSYIFQNYRESLLPWRTNFENVALPLQIQGKSAQEIRERVIAVQELFGLAVDWHGYPYTLSGGQQQMLAFLRALVTRPRLLLIDEPFSALDYENNLLLRAQLQAYYVIERPTIVLVTHNIEEAVHLAERIVVFSKRPTEVVEIIENPLPYPRTVSALSSQEFDHVKDRVLSVFQQAARV